MEATDKSQQEKHDTTSSKDQASAQMNKGSRWKADDVTKKNVAAMVTVINDSSNIGDNKRAQLAKQLQTRIETLLQECKMKGPDHNVLHAWLEQVLHDLKEMKGEDEEYKKLYVVLKKDIESFYILFE
jgi:hypothetical protein